MTLSNSSPQAFIEGYFNQFDNQDTNKNTNKEFPKPLQKFFMGRFRSAFSLCLTPYIFCNLPKTLFFPVLNNGKRANTEASALTAQILLILGWPDFVNPSNPRSATARHPRQRHLVALATHGHPRLRPGLVLLHCHPVRLCLALAKKQERVLWIQLFYSHFHPPNRGVACSLT